MAQNWSTHVLILFGFILGILGGGIAASIVTDRYQSDPAMIAATVVIAIFTAMLVVLQWQSWCHSKIVSRANYQVTLHDKRMDVFNAVEEMLHCFSAHGQPKIEYVQKYRKRIQSAHFLFPPDALSFANEIMDQSLEHHMAHIRYEPLRERAWNRELLTEVEERQLNLNRKRMQEIERWFHVNIENRRVLSEFSPFLNLPANL